MSKLVITVGWFNSAYRNRKAIQNALHIICTIYNIYGSLFSLYIINHHCQLRDATHSAKDHPLCKHWKQSVLRMSILTG